MTVLEGNLVIAGHFGIAGGDACNQVAVVEDSSWRSLGVFSGSVLSVAVHEGQLVAGGSFTEVDGVEANHLAWWDGSQWRPVGGGVNGEVAALASSAAGLWIGGDFDRTGDGTPAGNLALWAGDLVPVFVSDFQAAWSAGMAVVSWSLGQLPGEGEALRLDRLSAGGGRLTVDHPSARETTFAVRDPHGVPGDLYQLVLERRGAGEIIAEARLGSGPTAATLWFHPPQPNPANPGTTLSFDLPGTESVTLVLYDLAGRRLRTLIDGEMLSGPQTCFWDGRDASGRDCPSGIYLAQLRAGERLLTRNLGLVR